MQSIHVVLEDGSVEHLDFTRSSWASCIAKPRRMAWTHPVDDCCDPVSRLVGVKDKVEVIEVPEIVPLGEPIVWPPQSELSAWALHQLSHLCMDDCRAVLRPLLQISQEIKRPETDKFGQFLMF